MNVILSINGIAPAAQPEWNGGYIVTTSDLLSSGSGRSAETGRTIRYKVRGNVYKLQLKFKGLTADIASVYAQIKAFTLTVRFYDPSEGGYVTADFYSGDPSFVPNGDTAELSVNLIEI